jgi:hypothetical protein
METEDGLLRGLDPELARQIRESAARTGLQTHDPASRVIAEMWVAVAAMRQDRRRLNMEIDKLTRRVRVCHWYLSALIVLGMINVFLVLSR